MGFYRIFIIHKQFCWGSLERDWFSLSLFCTELKSMSSFCWKLTLLVELLAGTCHFEWPFLIHVYNFHMTLTTKFCLCLISVPSKPQNLTVQAVTSNSIRLSWREPKNLNGAIDGYHIFHMHDNQTGVEILKSSSITGGPYITYELPNLSEDPSYSIFKLACFIETTYHIVWENCLNEIPMLHVLLYSTQ